MQRFRQQERKREEGDAKEEDLREIREILEDDEELPPGFSRLILNIDQTGNVHQMEDIPIDEEAQQRISHPKGTLVFQLVHSHLEEPNNRLITIIARESNLYEDLNKAANYIFETVNNPQLYVIKFIPVGLYDFDTGEDQSRGRRVYPNDDVQDRIMRHAEIDQDISDVIIPVEIEPPRKHTVRVAKTLHPLSKTEPGIKVYGKQREVKIEAAQREAVRELSRMHEAEMKKRQRRHRGVKRKLSSNLQPFVNEINDLFDPILQDDNLNDDGSNLSEESVTDFIREKLSQPEYREALRYWIENIGSVNYSPNVVWPFVQWVLDQSDMEDDEKQVIQLLSELPEPPPEEVAFELHPVEEEDISWAQCDCCQKWRVTQQPLQEQSKEEELEIPWSCASVEAGGMDVRGMSREVQELSQGLADIRTLLRNRSISDTERKNLQYQERELCQSMCKITEESTEEAHKRRGEIGDRVVRFSSRVVENPVWQKQFREYDERVQQREDAEEEMQDFLEFAPEEEAEPKPKPKHKKTKTMKSEEEVMEDRAMLMRGEETIHIEGSVNDKIDLLEDLMEANQIDIDQLTADLHHLQNLETKVDDKGGNIDDEEKEAIRTELNQHQQNGDKEKWLRSLKDLLTQQNQYKAQLNQLQLRREKDPLIPKAAATGEQNDRYVQEAMLRMVHANPRRYALHYTQIAKEVAPHKQLGKAASDTVFAIVDPKKYNFLGVTQQPIGSATISVEKGFVIPRYRIQSEQDIDSALADLKEQNPALSSEEYVTRTRLKLQNVLRENQVLPYILGGAFYHLSREANQNPGHLAQVLKQLWPEIEQSNNTNIQELLKAYEKHLNSLEQQKKLDRNAAVKALQRASKGLEDVRLGKSSRRKLDWWKIANFPVNEPIVHEVQELQQQSREVLRPDVQHPIYGEVVPDMKDVQPSILGEVKESAVKKLKPPQSAPPRMVKKRKVKSTATSSSSQPLEVKKPRIEEMCSDVILNELRLLARELELDIANSDNGLKRLCQQKGGSLDAAIDFMRRWKIAVDAVRDILQSSHPNIHIDDRTLQQQVIVQSQSRGQFDVDHIVNYFTNK